MEWQSTGGATGILSMVPSLRKGHRVRVKHAGDEEWTEGVVALIWFGVEEVINVRLSTGPTVSYYIGCGMGDEMQVRVPA